MLFFFFFSYKNLKMYHGSCNSIKRHNFFNIEIEC